MVVHVAAYARVHEMTFDIVVHDMLGLSNRRKCNVTSVHIMQNASICMMSQSNGVCIIMQLQHVPSLILYGTLGRSGHKIAFPTFSSEGAEF